MIVIVESITKFHYRYIHTTQPLGVSFWYMLNVDSSQICMVVETKSKVD